MKLLKTIKNQNQYGSYQQALENAGVKMTIINSANMDILKYTAKDGRNIRVEVTAYADSGESSSETVNVYEA